MPSKTVGLEQAPWDKNGLVGYVWPERAGFRPVNDGIEWRPNEPFKAELELVGMSRGRSAAHFEWRDVATGRRMQMFMVDMLDLLNHSSIQKGRTPPGTRWIVRKRGQNYGIALAPEEDA